RGPEEALFRRSDSVWNRRTGELPRPSEPRRRGEVLVTSLHLGRRREALPCRRTPASIAPDLGDDIRIRHGEVGIPAGGWIGPQGLTCGCRKQKAGQASQPDLLLWWSCRESNPGPTAFPRGFSV